MDHIAEQGTSALDRAYSLAREMQGCGQSFFTQVMARVYDHGYLILCNAAPLALVAAKEAITKGIEEESIEEGLAHERRCYGRLLGTRDRLEALEAFRQKRKPVFEGE